MPRRLPVRRKITELVSFILKMAVKGSSYGAKTFSFIGYKAVDPMGHKKYIQLKDVSTQ